MKHLSYLQAKAWNKKFLCNKGINTKRKFQEYINSGGELPEGYSRSPYYFYSKHNTWVSWQDFLGATVSTQEAQPIAELNNHYLITRDGRIISNKPSSKGKPIKTQLTKTGQVFFKVRIAKHRFKSFYVDELLKKYFSQL